MYDLFEINNFEIEKITMNKLLFKVYKQSYFEIRTVLDILNVDNLPLDIQIDNNNLIFIRDLSNYLVTNGLKPYISK